MRRQERKAAIQKRVQRNQARVGDKQAVVYLSARVTELENLLRRIEDEWSDNQYVTSATMGDVQTALGILEP